MVGGAAALATPLLPEEGESASFPKDATLKFLRKLAGPEWSKIPEESKENVLKWATKDPLKALGLNSTIPNEYDRRLINTGLNSPYVYDITPERFNQTRVAQAVLPDEVLSGVNPKFTLIDPSLHKKGHYQNSRGFGGGEVGYNPATVKRTTPAHEIGAHGSQDVLKFRDDYDKSTLFSLDAGKELQKEYHDLVRGAPFKASQISSDEVKNNPAFKGYLQEIFDTYKNLPDEIAANEVGEYFESGLLNKDYKNLRDYNAFKDVFSSATKDAFRNYRELFPEKGKQIYDSLRKSGKYLATPFTLGAGLTAYDMQNPQEGEAALRGKVPSPNTSNVEKSIIDFLENRAVRPAEPDTLLRGIPKGGIPETEGGERFVHATPWDNVAKSAGKFAGGEMDVYAYDRLPGTKYYRGGSLAGDPLERTTIGDARGITWDDALDKAAGLYDKRVGKSLDELLGYGIKGDELVQHAENAAKENAGDILRDFKRGTYEADAFAKPGIWDGKDVPWGLNKTNPRLRNNFELYDAVVEAEKRGVDRKDIPEARILDSAVEKNPELEKMLTDSGRLYNTVKNIEAKDWIKTPKGMWETAKIALGAIAPGLPAAQAGIKKFVGDEVSKVGKSAKKIVSQTEAGEKANWEDYKNVLNWVDKPGLLLMGHDVAQAVGEPVARKVVDGISSAYDNFLMSKRREEQAAEDFFSK